MGEVARIPRAPRPNQDAIDALEIALTAARQGLAHTVVIMTVNPINDVETCVAGELSGSGVIFLVRAMYQAARQLFIDRPAVRG
jgi:hypothetical protein